MLSKNINECIEFINERCYRVLQTNPLAIVQEHWYGRYTMMMITAREWPIVSLEDDTITDVPWWSPNRWSQVMLDLT